MISPIYLLSRQTSIYDPTWRSQEIEQNEMNRKAHPFMDIPPGSDLPIYPAKLKPFLLSSPGYSGLGQNGELPRYWNY